jgi:Protein of unknown function (DUF2384)
MRSRYKKTDGRNIDGRDPGDFRKTEGFRNKVDRFLNLVHHGLEETMTQILEHIILDAHNPETGRLDAMRLAQTLAISTEEVAQILDYTARGVRANPDSVRIQPQLGELVKLVNRLRRLFDGSLEHTRIWLKAPHPLLSNRTPLSYLLEQNFDAVETLLHMAETGQTT